ncbi:hypothetical protein R2362_15250 [Mycobacteroides chelonae]|nr:hypothetical protein [Mycobacteroides chelonae]
MSINPIHRMLAVAAAPVAAAALAFSTPVLAQAAGPSPATPTTISTQAPAGPGCRHHNCWPRPPHGGWGGHGGGWGGGHGGWGGHR